MNADAEAIADYYDGAEMDFARWSPSHHLHFGYCAWGAGPLSRERMLARMSQEVLAAIQLEAPGRMLDLGCGFGTTTRLAAKRFPSAQIHGLTLSAMQARAATERSRHEGLDARTRFSQASYLAIPEAADSIDAAYAIESACYAPGTSKAALLHESARVLRSGGRLVVADAFVRHTRPLRGIARTFHDALCTRWKLPCLGVLDDFLAGLREAGFVDVKVRDISLRVGPSVLHVPLLTTAALLSPAIRNDPTRRANAMAPLYALLLALVPRTVGYFVIEATRAR